MKAKHLFVLFVAMLLTVSCSNVKDIAIRHIEVEQFKMTSTTQAVAKLKVSIYNPSSSTLHLNNVEGVLNRDDKSFATCNLAEKVSFPATGKDAAHISEGTVILNISISNMMALISGSLNLGNMSENNFNLSGQAKVKCGIASKTFSFDKMSLDQLIQKFK